MFSEQVEKPGCLTVFLDTSKDYSRKSFLFFQSKIKKNFPFQVQRPRDRLLSIKRLDYELETLSLAG